MASPTYKSALIVGAGRGLSASLARLFASEGLRVALAARDAEKLAPLCGETGAKAFACDAVEPDQVARLFSAVEAATGAPDVVVYNASARARGPVAELVPAEVGRAIMVSAFGGFLVAREAAARMMPKGHGAILFTGASASVKGYPLSAPFAMGKFALRGLAQSMAREMAPHGIRVNAICPGIVVDTAMRTAIEAQQRRYGLPETAERERSVPIGRVSVPDDVAGIAAFLASDESSYMTGESINLSGGLLMD